MQGSSGGGPDEVPAKFQLLKNAGRSGTSWFVFGCQIRRTLTKAKKSPHSPLGPGTEHKVRFSDRIGYLSGSNASSRQVGQFPHLTRYPILSISPTIQLRTIPAKTVNLRVLSIRSPPLGKERKVRFSDRRGCLSGSNASSCQDGQFPHFKDAPILSISPDAAIPAKKSI